MTKTGDRPLLAGTRGSPLALLQTRMFLAELGRVWPADRAAPQEHVVAVLGDAVQDRRLADIGGKGLFSKEIHEALFDHRIDFAVHSLKDLETELPPGIVLGCVLKREDPRDLIILGEHCGTPDRADPLGSLPQGAVIGTSSVRRQAQLLHARPDLKIALIRGNVQTRLRKLGENQCDASLLAIAGLIRLGMDLPRGMVLEPETMVPAAAQGIIGITLRASDHDLCEMLLRIEDKDARVMATAERALLAELDGSCRTPIGSFARLGQDGQMTLTGLVARGDGSFLLNRSMPGRMVDAARIGQTLGASLRADSPADLFD